MDLQINYSDGVVIKIGRNKVVFDAALCNERALRCVTHAHADHIRNLEAHSFMMSRETYELLRKALRIEKGLQNLRLSDTYRMDDLCIKQVSSGHILGSSQYILEYDSMRILHTGDFNTYETAVTKPAEAVETDYMVVEATYGIPSFVFPDREKIYAEIVRWIESCLRDGYIPAFKLYAIGKSQEMIKIVNDYLEVPVVVSRNVARACEVYRDFGIKLSYISVDDEEFKDIVRSGAYVYISSRFDNMLAGARVKWALATGWALRYSFSYVDKAFPLSSHADFNGILKHVSECHPKRVYTIHGYSEQLAKYLRRMGYEAMDLEVHIEGLDRLSL